VAEDNVTTDKPEHRVAGLDDLPDSTEHSSTPATIPSLPDPAFAAETNQGAAAYFGAVDSATVGQEEAPGEDANEGEVVS
jgi:hypothetical protein